jgi:hypothetical protein
VEVNEWWAWWKRTGRGELRRILLSDWDPIGVAGVGPSDEYDTYVDQVGRRLREGASRRELADYLASAERDEMGIEREADAELLELATFIRDWYGKAI